MLVLCSCQRAAASTGHDKLDEASILARAFAGGYGCIKVPLGEREREREREREGRSTPVPHPHSTQTFHLVSFCDFERLSFLLVLYTGGLHMVFAHPSHLDAVQVPELCSWGALFFLPRVAARCFGKDVCVAFLVCPARWLPPTCW